MDPDLFRVSLRAIFAAFVAEIADKFLLLGVDRDHRLPFSQSNANLGIDVGELRIPVGVAVALLGLAVGLQAVTRRIEQFGHQGAAHLVALRLQRLRQPSHALAGAPQRDSGSPRVVGSTSASRSASSVGSLQNRWFAPRPRPPNPRRRLILRQVLQTPPDRARRLPVAIATAAMPPYPAANASAAATRRRPRSSRKGATVKNRYRMGSTSITATIWYDKTVVNPIFTLS